MNLFSLFIAPVHAVVVFFAPHAGSLKTNPVRQPQRAASVLAATSPEHSHPSVYRAAAMPAKGLTGSSHLRARHAAYPASHSFIAVKPIHHVRVVRALDAGLPADRAGLMRMSGRFADVCAELDRLAAMDLRTA
jgi:hypothetical protein